MNCPVCHLCLQCLKTSLDYEQNWYACYCINSALTYSCYANTEEIINRFYLYLDSWEINSNQNGWKILIQDKQNYWHKINQDSKFISPEQAWNVLRRYHKMKAFL